jgi:N4-gp56 family major capsid protein
MSRFSTFVKVLFALSGVGPDVVTVTSGTVGNAGNVAADLITYLSARLLEVAEFNLVLDQFGDKHPLPSNNSLTIRFVREEKLTVASTPTQLTQGLAPDAVGFSVNQFEAIMEQYGNVVRIADLAELTARHPIVERTIYTLGLQAAETYDQLIFNVLDAATSNYRPNGKASDATLTASDKISYVDLVKILALHQDQGARPMDGGDYVYVAPPQVHGALLLDPDFKAAVQFGDPQRLYRGEVGRLAGMRVVVSNSPAFSPFTQGVVGSANRVYSSFEIGRFAYQISDLQNLRVYVVAPGGHTDPLEQSRLIGWKFAFKAIITNQNWIRRVRSAGLDSVNN